MKKSFKIGLTAVIIGIIFLIVGGINHELPDHYNSNASSYTKSASKSRTVDTVKFKQVRLNNIKAADVCLHTGSKK